MTPGEEQGKAGSLACASAAWVLSTLALCVVISHLVTVVCEHQ